MEPSILCVEVDHADLAERWTVDFDWFASSMSGSVLSKVLLALRTMQTGQTSHRSNSSSLSKDHQFVTDFGRISHVPPKVEVATLRGPISQCLSYTSHPLGQRMLLGGKTNSLAGIKEICLSKSRYLWCLGSAPFSHSV